jgi:hypothetical protein
LRHRIGGGLPGGRGVVAQHMRHMHHLSIRIARDGQQHAVQPRPASAGLAGTFSAACR